HASTFAVAEPTPAPPAVVEPPVVETSTMAAFGMPLEALADRQATEPPAPRATATAPAVPRPSPPSTVGRVVPPPLPLRPAAPRPAGPRRDQPRVAMPAPVMTAPPPISRTVTLAEGMTVADLAAKLDVKAKDVLRKLLEKRMMMTINSTLDNETATTIA